MSTDHAASSSYNPFAAREFDFAEYVDVRKCPILKVPGLGWVVGRHREVTEVALDSSTFASRGAGRLPDTELSDEDNMIFELDPPRHNGIRNAVKSTINTSTLRASAGVIERTSRRLVRSYVERGGGDMVAAVANPLPAFLIAHFLQLPDEVVPCISNWVHYYMSSGFAVTNRTEHGVGIRAGLPEFSRFFLDQLDQRRRSPNVADDDVLGLLIAADVGGRTMTEGELLAALLSMVTGSVHTSIEYLGFLAYRLADDSTLFDRIADDRALVPKFVREVLRLDTPGLLTGRVAARETLLAGADVAEGDKVLLLWGSANHDPEVFSHPDELDIDRPEAAKSLAFGFGRHLCLGAGLARMEGEIFVNVLLDQIQRLTFAGPRPRRVTEVGLTAPYPKLVLHATPRINP